jgi:hypothetical protein
MKRRKPLLFCKSSAAWSLCFSFLLNSGFCLLNSALRFGSWLLDSDSCFSSIFNAHAIEQFGFAVFRYGDVKARGES